MSINMVRSIKYKLRIQGCVVTLMSENSGSAILKRLLVNPAWIDLWNLISENQFDLGLWNRLSQKEKNFMILCANKLNIDNKQLHSANNNEAASSIERLKLIEGSILAGNINKDLLDEASTIIDDLSSRQMLFTRTANSLKKRLQAEFDKTKDSVDMITTLRRKR